MRNGWKIALCVGWMALAARADTLESRLGGAAVYDTGTGLTWVSNANLAAGSSFDNGVSTTDGLMFGDNALAWAADLVLGGHSDWRLPTTPFQDPTLSFQDFSIGGVLIDFGSGGTSVTASEMGHMYWHLTGSGAIHTQHPLISNVQVVTDSPSYWSSTPFGGFAHANFGFTFGANTTTGFTRNGFELAAWAVTDGDPFGATGGGDPIPEPTTMALLGIGLAGIRFLGKKKRRSAKA